MADADMVRRHLEFLDAPQNVVAFRLKDHANGDAWQDIILIMNGNKTAQKVNIPQGAYTSVCQNQQINLSGITTIEGNSVEVAPQEALIIVK